MLPFPLRVSLVRHDRSLQGYELQREAGQKHDYSNLCTHFLSESGDSEKRWSHDANQRRNQNQNGGMVRKKISADPSWVMGSTSPYLTSC